MSPTTDSYHSETSQQRVSSLVVSDVLVANSSTNERTNTESSVSLQDPNGPPWQVSLAQKLCRAKRLGDIPGWFDRWDVFLGPNDLANSIFNVQNGAHQASLRRRVWKPVVVHSILITALVATGVYVPNVTKCLRLTFPTAWHRILLLISTILDLVLLKLVLNVRLLRPLLWIVYSMTLAVLVTIQAIVSDHKAIVCACGLVSFSQLVVWTLCGVQRRTHDGSVVFLHHATIGGIAAAVTTVVTIVIHVSSGVFIDSDHLVLVVLTIVGVALVGAYEATLLFRTLAPDEAMLGLYCIHLDLVVGTLVIPTVILLLLTGGMFGLMICTPLDMLRQLYATVWTMYSGQSTFGFVWHLQWWPKRQSRVGTDPPSS